MFKVKAIGKDKTIRLGLKESRGQLSDLMVNYNKKTGRNKKKKERRATKEGKQHKNPKEINA